MKRHDRLYPAIAAAIREGGFYTNGVENSNGLVRTTVCTWSTPDGSFFSGNSFWVSRLADGWYLGAWGAQYYHLPGENRIVEICHKWCTRFRCGTYSEFDAHNYAHEPSAKLAERKPISSLQQPQRGMIIEDEQLQTRSFPTISMTHPTVDYVLELIERMPDEDRLALEMRLSQRLEAEWNDAVAENRRIAQDRRITDETIERAIHRRRYGE